MLERRGGSPGRVKSPFQALDSSLLCGSPLYLSPQQLTAFVFRIWGRVSSLLDTISPIYPQKPMMDYREISVSTLYLSRDRMQHGVGISLQMTKDSGTECFLNVSSGEILYCL
jgi:hypothetical protein